MTELKVCYQVIKKTGLRGAADEPIDGASQN